MYFNQLYATSTSIVYVHNTISMIYLVMLSSRDDQYAQSVLLHEDQQKNRSILRDHKLNTYAMLPNPFVLFHILRNRTFQERLCSHLYQQNVHSFLWFYQITPITIITYRKYGYKELSYLFLIGSQPPQASRHIQTYSHYLLTP